jgi:CRP-like cAMP-binding protein
MPEVPDVSAIAQQVKSRITHIEDQLKQHETLVNELERLRDALTRLEGTARSGVSATRRRVAKQAEAPRRGGTAKPASARAGAAPGSTAEPSDGRRRTGAAKRASSPVRAARGENRAKVLEALKKGPMTAGEVAKVTGIGTGTVSTMLNKMAKSGELAKAQRGYQLPQSP